MSSTVVVTTHDLEPAVRLRDRFEDEDYAVELLTAGERIAQVEDPVLLVITGGLDEKRARRLLREAAGLDRLPIIALADSADAVPENARRHGVSETFVKPVDIDEVALVGRRLVERRRLQELTGIVGETDAIREALERVMQIAPVHATVLVTGESGTGKELVARGIHALSPRRHRPFIAANVAALPETLLESELFGHEKGAFTGAVAQRKGFFELAQRGTLFLDEIGEMPLAVQTKLLRVLEEREVRRVGGEESIQIDVRVIAASNRELRRLVELGDFRRDLYHRLNVLHIEMPPLRERREDIPLLVDTFIRQASSEHDRRQVALSPDALEILLEYDWPGNVRELKNLAESMVVLEPGGMITPDDIPPEIRDGAGRRSVLPVPVQRQREDGREQLGPELEFVFRTLMQLRLDVEDLRGDFDEYRRSHPEPPARLPVPPSARSLWGDAVGRGGEDAGDGDAGAGNAGAGKDESDVDGVPEDEGVVVYRSGMTLNELEREAITAALLASDGNRREAAQALGIGERTLYRKIKEYEIPL